MPSTKSDSWEKYREAYIKSMETQALNLIRKSPLGISHSELARLLGRERKNVRKYLVSLMEQKLIVRAPGKFGRYHVLSKTPRRK